MTKKIIFFSILLVLIGLLIFGYTLFVTKSKGLVADFIKKNLAENASIGHIGIEYPLRIVLRDVRIFQKKGSDKIDIFKTDRIYIYPHPVLSFKNRILISKVDIIKPEIIVTRGRDGSFNIPIPNGMFKAQQPRNLFISRIDLEGGTLKYSDRKLGDRFSLFFENIDARFDSVSFPLRLGSSRFRLFADIKNNKSQNATLSLNGYTRLKEKSLKAKLSLEDLDVHTLEPLYNRYLAGLIKEGILNFYSRIETQDQTLKADCQMNIETPEDNLIAEFLLAMNLKDFTIKISSVRGNIFEILLDKVLTAKKSNTTDQVTD